MCALRRCARPTEGTHGRTAGPPILLISIRFPLKNKEGRDTPKDTPALVVLVFAGLIGAGLSAICAAAAGATPVEERRRVPLNEGHER